MSSSSIRSALAVMLFTLLQACGGGDAGGAGSSAASKVFGVAATGLAIDGSVTLKDSSGATRTADIAQPGGEFSIDVTGLAPPYFLKATDKTGATTLYSIAGDAGNVNINPLSNLVVVAAAMSVDPLAKSPDLVFDNPPGFARLTSAQIEAATSSVMAQMSPAFRAELSANGASSVNPLTDAFRVGNGLDKAFDRYALSLNAATGEVQEREVASNTTTLLGLVDKLGTFPAAGIYDGIVSAPPAGGGNQAVRDMVITSAGEMRYVTDKGVQVVANLTLTGATLSGSGKAYAPTQNGQAAGFQFADGSQAIDFAIDGTLAAGTLAGSYRYGSFRDSFSFALNAEQTSVPAALGKIAGTYVSASDSSTLFIGHVAADGKIRGSGQGIGYSGLIQVVDPTRNIYRVTLAYQKGDTYGYTSGLATFHEAAPSADTLPMATALVPDGYTEDVASLSYSAAVAGSHGKLLLHLAGPLQQISVSAVRLSVQLQTIVAHSAVDAMMVQIANSWTSLATLRGDSQLSTSAAQFAASGSGSFTNWGTLTVISNPGNIALSGTGQVAIPLPPAIASVLPTSSAGVVVNSASGDLVANWNSFNVGRDATVSFKSPSSSGITVNGVTTSGSLVTGALATDAGVIIQNASGAVAAGGLILNGNRALTLTGASATVNDITLVAAP